MALLSFSSYIPYTGVCIFSDKEIHEKKASQVYTLKRYDDCQSATFVSMALMFFSAKNHSFHSLVLNADFVRVKP